MPRLGEITYLENLKEVVIEKATKDFKGFDTFVSLINKEWQGPSDLAESWLKRIAGEEYRELREATSDKETFVAKLRIQKNILDILSNNLGVSSERPTFFEWLMPSFEKKSAHNLSPEKEDRITAKEIGIPYRSWKSILGFLACNEQIVAILEDMSIYFPPGVDEDVSEVPIIALHNPDEKLIELLEKLLPEENMIHRSFDNENGLPIVMLLFRKNILTRYESITGKDIANKISRIRGIFRKKIGEIPVWQKK